MAGYDMLQARFVRTKADNETVKEFAKDVAITPLAIPIISGPGAITAAIVMMNDSPLMMQKLTLVFAIALVLFITLLFLLSARRIIKFLGESGNKILMRIMGLIVMVIAVEFFFGGVKPIIQDILLVK
jgi:multiple antibiotic resistance protein